MEMWLNYFRQYLEREFPEFLSEKVWNYKDDLCVIGAHDLAEATKDQSWDKQILCQAHYLMMEDGSVVNWKEGENNIDKISFGKSLRIFRDLTKDERYAKAVDRAYEFLKHYPRTETGNFWHKDIYPNQVWLDGLYMAMPFYAKTISENGDRCWDDIIDQFESAHRLLWDEKKQLYVHGCDVSRKADWADPVTGRSPGVWLRAEGWYLMALCDVYELAQSRTDRAGELAELLKRAVDGILLYQDTETGMFYQSVDHAELEDNYLETSGSAMVAYALMKGARLGILSEALGEEGVRVLEGIRTTYLRQEEDGLHLYGICASAGLGAGPDPHNRKDRTGKPEYYVSEVQMRDNQHGSAVCMMAVSELLHRG